MQKKAYLYFCSFIEIWIGFMLLNLGVLIINNGLMKMLWPAAQKFFDAKSITEKLRKVMCLSLVF